MNGIRDTYREQLRIRFYETDIHGTASLPTVCNLLQEVALNDAIEVNYLATGVREFRWGIVTPRMRVQMDRLPAWNEKITISTWLSPFSIGGRFIDRHYLLEDGQGRRLGRGTATAIVFDRENRSSIPIPPEFTMLPSRARDETLLEIDKVARPSAIDVERHIEVSFSDLDGNRHVNNVRYISWALDTVTPDIPGLWICHEVNVQYKRELTEGDSAAVQTEVVRSEDGLTMVHTIVNTTTGKESAGMTTWWKRAQE